MMPAVLIGLSCQPFVPSASRSLTRDAAKPISDVQNCLESSSKFMSLESLASMGRSCGVWGKSHILRRIGASANYQQDYPSSKQQCVDQHTQTSSYLAGIDGAQNYDMDHYNLQEAFNPQDYQAQYQVQGISNAKDFYAEYQSSKWTPNPEHQNIQWGSNTEALNQPTYSNAASHSKTFSQSSYQSWQAVPSSEDFSSYRQGVVNNQDINAMKNLGGLQSASSAQAVANPHIVANSGWPSNMQAPASQKPQVAADSQWATNLQLVPKCQQASTVPDASPQSSDAAAAASITTGLDVPNTQQASTLHSTLLQSSQVAATSSIKTTYMEAEPYVPPYRPLSTPVHRRPYNLEAKMRMKAYRRQGMQLRRQMELEEEQRTFQLDKSKLYQKGHPDTVQGVVREIINIGYLISLPNGREGFLAASHLGCSGGILLLDRLYKVGEEIPVRVIEVHNPGGRDRLYVRP